MLMVDNLRQSALTQLCRDLKNEKQANAASTASCMQEGKMGKMGGGLHATNNYFHLNKKTTCIKYSQWTECPYMPYIQMQPQKWCMRKIALTEKPSHVSYDECVLCVSSCITATYMQHSPSSISYCRFHTSNCHETELLRQPQCDGGGLSMLLHGNTLLRVCLAHVRLVSANAAW